MRLIPKKDEEGRVPAVEVMINTPYIKECIQEREKTILIRDAVAAGISQYGMQTFDQSIYSLYQERHISYEQGLRHSSSPDNFKLRVMGVRAAADVALEDHSHGNGVTSRVADALERDADLDCVAIVVNPPAAVPHHVEAAVFLACRVPGVTLNPEWIDV